MLWMDAFLHVAPWLLHPSRTPLEFGTRGTKKRNNCNDPIDLLGLKWSVLFFVLLDLFCLCLRCLRKGEVLVDATLHKSRTCCFQATHGKQKQQLQPGHLSSSSLVREMRQQHDDTMHLSSSIPSFQRLYRYIAALQDCKDISFKS